MGNLTKMSIIAYDDCQFKTQKSKYDVMLNPESIKWDHSIDYNKEQVPGSSAPSPKYKKSPAQNLSFDLVIDCTGVIDSTRVNLPDEIKKLRGVIYNYEGDIHRPYYILLQWGDNFIFKGLLTNFDLTYNFFKPDGTPLRAKVSLKFISYVDPTTLSKKDNNQSPDITHLVDVMAGDSLPQLSQKIYKTSNYMVQVAKFNNLDKFRYLQPGQKLIFPSVTNELPSKSPKGVM